MPEEEAVEEAKVEELAEEEGAKEDRGHYGIKNYYFNYN